MPIPLLISTLILKVGLTTTPNHQELHLCESSYTESITKFSAHHHLAAAERDSLLMYGRSLVAGEQINNRCKYYLALIQLFFTTD